jgi:hypothetical protein
MLSRTTTPPSATARSRKPPAALRVIVPLTMRIGVVTDGRASASPISVKLAVVNVIVPPARSIWSAPGQLALCAALIAVTRFAGVVIAAGMKPAQLLCAWADDAKANARTTNSSAEAARMTVITRFSPKDICVEECSCN